MPQTIEAMKTEYPVLLLIILMTAAGCQNTSVEYYSNGNKKTVFRKKGEQVHGENVWYYRNGQPELVVTYKNGVIHGTSTNYYYNGRKEQEEHYRKGLRQGKSTKWYDNGKVQETAYYVNDTLDGKYKVYYREGTLQISGAFARGVYDSTWTWWDKQGLKVGEADFEHGDGIQVSWYINGREKSKIPFKDNKKHGKTLYFNQQGDTTKITWFKEGNVVDEEVLENEDNL